MGMRAGSALRVSSWLRADTIDFAAGVGDGPSHRTAAPGCAVGGRFSGRGAIMLKAPEAVDVATLPLAPKNPLPYRQQLSCLRTFHTGEEMLRDAGGPVTRLQLAPNWLMPPVVIATSPQGGRDILAQSDAVVERTEVHHELRHLFGPNLFDVTHEEWLPRRRALQPVFTKQHVRAFGGHMAQAAEMVASAWTEGADVDLDAACRRLTLRALGRSVLGVDLDEQPTTIASRSITQKYVADRGLRPLRAPRWLPTPARRGARGAAAALRGLAADVLRTCREDPTRDAPLVHALLAATDPDTGQGLSDEAIRDELVVFMLAGHDTTSTTLTYALWALGRHLDLQERVGAEVAAIGDRGSPTRTYRSCATPPRCCTRRCGCARRPPRSAERPPATSPWTATACPPAPPWFTASTPCTATPHCGNPLIFDPDRFSPDNCAGRDRWQYLPFGGGPRSCIGDHFAMLEATLALATIIRRIEIHSSADEFPIAVPFTAVAAAPIPARVCARTTLSTHQTAAASTMSLG